MILRDFGTLRLNLTGKLLIVVAAILVICQFLMSGFFLWQNSRTLNQQHQLYLDHTLDIIASAVAIDTWNFNAGSLEIILAPYRHDEAFSSITIEDNSGNQYSFKTEFAPQQQASQQQASQQQKIQLSRPIFVDVAGVKQQVGQLIAVDHQDYIVTKLQDIIWRQMTELMLMLVLLAVGLSFALNRLVLLPIKKINSALFQAITSKDSILQNPVEGLRDEFEEVALSIVALSARLSGDLQLISESRQQLLQEKDKTEAALTHLKITQEALLQSEKQASLGSLVSGVAHEVNTPLGIIITSVTCMSDIVKKINEDLTSSKLSRQQLQDRIAQLQEAISLITHNADRASLLITNFKLLAKEQTSEAARPFNLSELIREIVISQQRQLAEANVIVFMDIETDLFIESIPGLFNQILCALLNNVAHHAYPMSLGGSCCIELKKEADDLVLRCKDQGVGISVEQQKHVFDPFFTTKLGSGTNGLGLAIVYRIVRSNLGGQIAVHSQMNEGTCFEIRFPCLQST